MSEWIEHEAGSLPSILVEVRLRDGRVEKGPVSGFEWDSSTEEPESDIIAYRIVEEEA